MATLSTYILLASETSDIIICVAIYYEKGSTGNNFLHKEKFCTALPKKDKMLKKIRETVRLLIVRFQLQHAVHKMSKNNIGFIFAVQAEHQ